MMANKNNNNGKNDIPHWVREWFERLNQITLGLERASQENTKRIEQNERRIEQNEKQIVELKRMSGTHEKAILELLKRIQRKS